MKVLDMFSLKGRVALVTGGAGRYGKQIVSALAEAGATIYIASRNLEVLEKLAEVHRKEGSDVVALQYDQEREDSILALRDEIAKRSGRIDVLVNNAVTRIMSDWYDSAEKFEKSMRINSTGIFLMCRAFGEVMKEQKNGSIINISSIYGMISTDYTLYEGGLGYELLKNAGVKIPEKYSPDEERVRNSGGPDYLFHKAGMINLTKFTAALYGQYNVRCNCISPGGLVSEDFKTPEEFVRRYSKKTFLGRMANTADLKGTIVYLASDASAYITGINIIVDGGYTSK